MPYVTGIVGAGIGQSYTQSRPLTSPTVQWEGCSYTQAMKAQSHTLNKWHKGERISHKVAWSEMI